MSEATTVEVTNEPAPIEDDSSMLEKAGTLVKNSLGRFTNHLNVIGRLEDELTEAYEGASFERCLLRSFFLLSDTMPDWWGSGQAYKQAVNRYEIAIVSEWSDKKKKRYDSNIRAHTRRGTLDARIVLWVRDNIQGMDKVEKGKERDSAAFKKAMRAQYERGYSLKVANPIVCPDHWLDTAPDDVSVDAKSEDTTASALNKAVTAVSAEDGMSVAEKLRAAQRLVTAFLTPAVQPNAKVPGGRDAAAIAARDLAMQVTAAAQILSNKVTGEALTDAQATFEKYSYSEDAS